MSSSDISIRVQDISKCYHIYATPRDRLKQFVMPRAQRLAGQSPKQYFREFWALKDVSFEVRKGETVGIIGRNGSGKSTLLQIICGTLSCSSGSVQTNGRIAALLELGSGFNPEFTGRENVRMSCALLGLSPKETDERFDDIAAFADIGEFIEQPTKTYSSGMFIRLAFAVNIVSDPEIMIVDEALAVGDMRFQAKCMTALTRIQERGATVLFVSHDITALKSLCSRGIYLEHGVVQTIGPAADVAAQYVRTMREEMNADGSVIVNKASVDVLAKSDEASKPAENRESFKACPEFAKAAASSRYGTGEAKIAFADLLDEALNPIRYADFDQTVHVRMYFESSVDAEISANYYILDDKRNFILGSGPLLAGHPLITAKAGGRYMISFKTRLPLHEGNYSVQLQLTSPIVAGTTAQFLDVIDDAVVFKVGRRENARLWAQVSVPNSMELSCF